MTGEPELFPDEYKPFGELPDDYPKHKFKPANPAFHGRGHVITTGRYPRKYLVDLDIGECTCPKGTAFMWSDRTNSYYANMYCTHKLRMICTILDRWPAKGTRELGEIGYVKALATRYNPFETVSAFHKELRRGDFTQAWYWGLILSAKRKVSGVIKYLMNIIYEETRDHELAMHLITLSKQSSITMQQMAGAIAWFCATPKKWELPHRMAIFKNEMKGYDSLAKDFSPDVAKGHGIIPAENEPKLKRDLEEGFSKRDWVRFQRGLKGLQKMVWSGKHGSLEEYRYYLYDYLYDFASDNLPDTHPVWHVVSVVNARIEAGDSAGYHELNAIADAISGEPVSAGELPAKRSKSLKNHPKPDLPLAIWPPIPQYAHDNHTWEGKALMRRYGHELKPGAEQTHLDFRWCGAYFGVAYRMICFDQHRKVIDVPWSDVKWPKDLYRIVDMLWY